jgi:cell division protease FtsH
MSAKLGTVRYAVQQYQYLESGDTTASASPETLQVIDDEVRRITSEQYARAQQLLKDHRYALEHLTHQLLVTECVDGAAVKQALAVQPA